LLLSRIRTGRLTIATRLGKLLSHGTAHRQEGGPIRHRWGSPRRLLFRSGIACAETFIDSDWEGPDLPSGPLIGVPFTMEANDVPLCVRYRNEPMRSRTLPKIVEGWSRLGSPHACLDITVHAHVFGRPYGAQAFLDSLAVVRRNPHCWLTNHAELAARWARD
jgi:hypothetical protein